MSLKPIQSLTTDQGDRTWALAWNPNGTLLASSGADKIIRIWAQRGNDESWYCSSRLADTHTKTIRRLSWSPCGQFLASASFDGTVCVWKRNFEDSTWSMSDQLEGHENEVKSVAWSHDGRFLASCGRDKTVWIWERSQDDLSGSNEDESENIWECSDVKNDHTKDVKHVVWHPKHNILLSCSYDDTVKFFHLDESDWKCYDTLTDHKSTVWSADFSSSGEFVVTCSDDRTVKIWKNHNHDKLPQIQARSWKCVSTLQGYHSRSIYDVSWNINNDIIASGSGDNSIVIYKQSNDQGEDGNFVCVTRYQNAHDCDINTMAWNPKIPNLLASGGDDEFIKLWLYKDDEKGMIPPKIVDMGLKRLTELFEKIDSTSVSDIAQPTTNEYKTTIHDHSQLLDIISNLQTLQDYLNQVDHDIRTIHKILGFKIESPNSQQPVIISKIDINSDCERGCLIDALRFEIYQREKDTTFRCTVTVDRDMFQLFMPKRANKLFCVTGDLFLIEKTGDFYRVAPTGESIFLLGHLFSLTDVKIITAKDHKAITYIISADRDEKIRITNYPETHKIERYGFGHEHFIRRLIVINSELFLSIDQEDTVCMWNLAKLQTLEDQDVFKPEKIISFKDTLMKRPRAS